MKKSVKVIMGMIIVLSVSICGYFIITNNVSDKNKVKGEKNSSLESNKSDKYESETEDLDKKTKEQFENTEKNNTEKKKTDVNNSGKINETSSFTKEKAVQIAEKKYGKDEDTIYSPSNNMENLNGKIGYMIQIKSKELLKQGGNGVIFTVLVTETGEIIEL